MCVISSNQNDSSYKNFPLEVRKAACQVGDALLCQTLDKVELKHSQQIVAGLDRKAATALMVGHINNSGLQGMAYVSTPITGGDRLYDFLESKNAKTKSELTPEALKEYGEGGHRAKLQARGRNCRRNDGERQGRPGPFYHKSPGLATNPVQCQLDRNGKRDSAG